MEIVIRVVVIYLFLVAVFRLAGKRTLAEATTFDLLLLLIISETTQQALLGQDHSIVTALLLVSAFVLMNIGMSLWKQRSKTLERLLEDLPVVLVENGQPIQERLDKARVNLDDVLESARLLQGLTGIHEIRYAVLERSGEISIVPRLRAAVGTAGRPGSFEP